MKILRTILIGLIVGFVPSVASSLEESTVIRIALHECEPFVIKDDTAEHGFSGLSIYLLDYITQSSGLTYVAKEYELQPMLEAVKNGEADAGVSCISITEERERFVDFSHSIYESHLTIAARKPDILGSIFGVLKNRTLLLILGTILIISVTFSLFVWFFEHKTNRKLYTASHRRGKILEALFPGLLWLTKGPPSYWTLESFPGRLIAVLGSMSNTLIVASMTALLASVFTTHQLKSQIKGPQDLHGLRVAALASSTSSGYLDRTGIGHRKYSSVKAMLVDLDAGDIDAVVEDAPVLQYLLKKAHAEDQLNRAVVLPVFFEKQNYGFILPDDHSHMEVLNQKLLKARRDPEWQIIQDHYLKEVN